MPQRLIALRHGQTDWNAEQRMQGQTDIPLNETGRNQALAAAPYVAALHPSRIVSSDSMRAAATAQTVADITGQTVETDTRLREIFCGAWEGLTLDECEVKFPEEWAAWQAGEDVARGGGETRLECATRMADFVEPLLDEDASGETLLVVGHGITLRYGLELMAQRGVIEMDGPCPRFENAGHFVFDVVPPESRKQAAEAANVPDVEDLEDGHRAS